VVNFFADYLVSKKTNYTWNNLSSPTFEVNVEVGQRSALSPILLALYLFPFLYILENCLKNLNIPISIISFVDDCYDLKLELRLHLGKGLREVKGIDRSGKV